MAWLVEPPLLLEDEPPPDELLLLEPLAEELVATGGGLDPSLPPPQPASPTSAIAGSSFRKVIGLRSKHTIEGFTFADFPG
jgi:hypothetical protein